MFSNNQFYISQVRFAGRLLLPPQPLAEAEDSAGRGGQRRADRPAVVHTPLHHEEHGHLRRPRGLADPPRSAEQTFVNVLCGMRIKFNFKYCCIFIVCIYYFHVADPPRPAEQTFVNIL